VTELVPYLRLEDQDFDAQLEQACGERGLFVLNLPHDERFRFDIAALTAEVTALFDQPEPAKLRLASPTGHPHRGWRQFYDEAGRLTYERVSIGRFDSRDEARRAGVDAAYVDFYAPGNVWPDDGGFRSSFEAFRSATSALIEELVARLPSGMGVALTKDETVPNNVSCAVSRYFGRAPDDPTVLFRDHVDLTFFSLVWQADGRSALQVERPDGTWVDVAAAEDQLIGLCGDMLRRRSAGATVNGRHRVVAPVGRDRLTVLNLYMPSLATELEPAAPPERPEAVRVWSLVAESAERYMDQAATPGEVAAWRDGRPYVPEPSQTGAWRRQPPQMTGKTGRTTGGTPPR
jgi:flavonol synthase